MAHGGKRANAGRKNGSATKRKAIIKREAVARGLDPADVLQELLEHYHKVKNREQMRLVAKDLMPYRHPRKASIQHSGPGGAPIPFTFVEVSDATAPGPGSDET